MRLILDMELVLALSPLQRLRSLSLLAVVMLRSNFEV